MLALAQIDQKYLTWRQPRWTREYYELRAGDCLLGSLAMKKWFSDQAEVNTATAAWIFDRKDFFRTAGIAFERQSKIEVARFEYEWLKDCQISLSDGRSFKWFRTKVLEYAWAMTTESDRLLFEMALGMRWFKREGLITLEVKPSIFPNLDLLICLSFYLGYCEQQDTAAAVAATTGVTAAVI